MKILNYILCVGAASALLAGASNASTIAGLAADGTIYTAVTTDSTTFNTTKATLANLPTDGFSYVDMTYGNGRIYGLRSDGAVYSSTLSGSTSLVSTVGWSSSVTKIDFANGTLFGLKSGTNTSVVDAAGTSRLVVNGANFMDFGVRDSGQFTLALSGANSWVYTFNDGFVGGTSGNVDFRIAGVGVPNIAIDVNGTFTGVLNQGPGVQYMYQPSLGVNYTFVSGNTIGAVTLALSEDNAHVYYLRSDMAVRKSLATTNAAVYLGVLGDGTGVGLAEIPAIPEPSSIVLLFSTVTVILLVRRRQRSDRKCLNI